MKTLLSAERFEATLAGRTYDLDLLRSLKAETERLEESTAKARESLAALRNVEDLQNSINNAEKTVSDLTVRKASEEKRLADTMEKEVA